MPRTLRTRLLATVLLLIAAAGVIIIVVTAVVLREFLIDRLDADLRSASRRFAAVIAHPPPPRSPDLVVLGPGQSPGTLGAIVRNGRVFAATVVDDTGHPSSVPATDVAPLATIPPGEAPRSLNLSSLGSYRVTAFPGPGDDVVVLGLPEAALQATVRQLVVTEIIVTGIALVGAGTIGAALARRELEPLEHVAALATRVSTRPLDRGEVDLAERVPESGMRHGTEVGQVGLALNHMLDHIARAFAARQESEERLRRFVADASHELRTPLAAIRGYAELARRDETLNEVTTRSIARISAQAERMSSLVDDLLLLARLDAGRPLERAPVDLTRLVVDAVGDAHAAAPNHHWQLDLPDRPVTVEGDALRLTQVVANLLANARTHTPPGTTVVVALSPAPANRVQLTVTDNGPGIPADLLPHVFARFARGSRSRSREDGSTGLGLSIVDAVVAAHQGTVSVRSHPGRTTFTVQLPGEVAPVTSEDS